MKKLFSVLTAILMVVSCFCSCAPDNALLRTETCVVTAGESKVDFVIDYSLDREIKILQITDTQLQNWYGARTEERANQVAGIFANGMAKDHTIRAWRYVTEGVNRAQPDLIIATGDNVYGELDDDGRMWLEFIEQMDSYKIPWLVVFGNHDNESAKGVTWQIEQLKKSKYCVFKQGKVTGNCNYNVVVSRRGTPQYLIYMMDTNGCHVVNTQTGEGLNPDNVDYDKLKHSQGYLSDQIDWFNESAQSARSRYGEIPMLLFQHIPLAEARDALVMQYPDDCENNPFRPNLPGDSGIAREIASASMDVRGFWRKLKEYDCKGVFFGHQHKIATSIAYDGIKVTYGLKTSTYDYHASDMLGTTQITLKDSGKILVEYLFTSFDYDTNRV